MLSPQREKRDSPKGGFENCREITLRRNGRESYHGICKGELATVEFPPQAGGSRCVGYQSTWCLSFTNGPGAKKMDGRIDPRMGFVRQVW